MTNSEIATIILQQLGGNKFKAMTGAKHIFAVEKGLQFKLPARFAKNGITLVEIKLNGMDTYDITFSRIAHVKSELGIGRTPVVKEVAVVNMVYDDQLQEIFTEYTGLDTHL